MNVSASYYSDIGGRKENEDAVALLESGDTMAGLIADGLGGHKGGKAAAQLAVQTVGAASWASLSRWSPSGGLWSRPTPSFGSSARPPA